MMPDTALWKSGEASIVPAGATTGMEIVKYARQLTKREVQQLADAYNAGSYELASTFVWAKAMAALKKQLASLGMSFVGEILARPDIEDSSSVEQTVTDYEAIRLAEDLGMVRSLEAMRLRHSLELITHLASQDVPDGDMHDVDEEVERMNPEDAVACLRACIQSVLGKPNIEPALKFAEFRRELETRAFAPGDAALNAIVASPYFYKRTTLSVMLAIIRVSEGAQLENTLANINTILPLIWPMLRKTEKWQTGQMYAEVYAAGKTVAVAGLRKALTQVKGFDFVPESLRSMTFTRAAAKVLETHHGLDNFYNEFAAIQALASLGDFDPDAGLPNVHARGAMCPAR